VCVYIVKAVDARTTSAKLAAKMKADSTTPEKQKVVNTKFVLNCMCVCVHCSSSSNVVIY